MNSAERARLSAKIRCTLAIAYCLIAVFRLPAQNTQPANTPTKKTKTVVTTKTTKTSGNTVKYLDLAAGGKLPYGGNVTITGQLDDLQCGRDSISQVLNITGITVSYLGQTSQPSAGHITGDTWTAPLGALPADTAINLQFKITGNIKDATKSKIAGDLLADPTFRQLIENFGARAVGQDAPVFAQEAAAVLSVISSKAGALTIALQNDLPSCTVITDVSAAAIKSLRDNIAALNAPVRMNELVKLYTDPNGVKLEGFDPNKSAQQMHDFVRNLQASGNYKTQAGEVLDPKSREWKSVDEAIDRFLKSYDAIVGSLAGDVVAQLTQGVELTQTSTTQDLNKYAGFDVGALYAPRINELREFNMVHIYPWGPVELDTSGKIPFTNRWSIAVGVAVADLSSNSNSRVKGNNAFVYGLGYRLNKYFRLTVGGMVYRDASGNRLLNEAFIGPSVDITAFSALKQVFASSSSKQSSTTKTETTTTQSSQ